MNTFAPAVQCFEFSFPPLDTVVAVETSPAGVLVRASRDSFSEARKACFIRTLAAEGFIGDEFYWKSQDDVRWVVDAAWFMPGAASLAQTRRSMRRLLFCAVGLWLLLVGGLFLHRAEPLAKVKPDQAARPSGQSHATLPDQTPSAARVTHRQILRVSGSNRVATAS